MTRAKEEVFMRFTAHVSGKCREHDWANSRCRFSRRSRYCTAIRLLERIVRSAADLPLNDWTRPPFLPAVAEVLQCLGLSPCAHHDWANSCYRFPRRNHYCAAIGLLGELFVAQATCRSMTDLTSISSSSIGGL